MKIDGKKIKIDKGAFDWYKHQIETSLEFDNEENEMGLTKKDIKLLSWNCAAMVYHEHQMFK